MRKGPNGGNVKKRKRIMKIVATMSLPEVDRPTAGTPCARAKSFGLQGYIDDTLQTPSRKPPEIQTHLSDTL